MHYQAGCQDADHYTDNDYATIVQLTRDVAADLTVNPPTIAAPLPIPPAPVHHTTIIRQAVQPPSVEARSALTLKEIFLRAYEMEKGRQESACRLACQVVAEAPTRANSGALSSQERKTLLSVASKKASPDVVRKDERLWAKLYYDMPAAQVRVVDEESQRIGRAPSEETAWLVLKKAFIRAVRKYVPRREHFSEDDAYHDVQQWGDYGNWLATGNGPHCEFRHEEFTTLERRPEFTSELLKELHEKSLAEYKILRFPEPRMTEPASLSRPQKKALAFIRESENPPSRDAIAEHVGVNSVTVGRWCALPTAKAGPGPLYRAGVRNDRSTGYYIA